MPTNSIGVQRHPPTPVTWLVLGDKQGDNSRAEIIAERLGWPYTRKYVRVRDEFLEGKPRFGASLDHLDLQRSDSLVPPWPDLIITAGQRPSMVALWVKLQSGNRTRIVMLGKPKGRMPDFDLIVASSEYQVPPLESLVRITLPLMNVDSEEIAAEAERWRERLASLPRPLIAIMVGGETGQFRMNAAVARRVAALGDHIHRNLGGTAYVTTSRRTRPEVVEALRDALPPASVFFVWNADGTDNPYRALLGTADGFIVTGDSASMMAEVVYLQKSLAILPLPQGFMGTVDQVRRSLIRRLFNPRRETLLDRWRCRLALLVFRLDKFELLGATRDFCYFHRTLINNGLAVWAGESLRPPSNFPSNDLNQVVDRINRLFEQQGQRN